MNAACEVERDEAVVQLAALQPQLVASAKLIEIQQMEIVDSHHFTAMTKLTAALERSGSTRLACSFGSWRAFAALLPAGAAATGQHPMVAAATGPADETSAAADVRRASKEQIDKDAVVPRAARKPPLPASSSGGLLVRASQRPTSPKPQLAEQLESALANRSSSPAARASSPKPDNPLQADLAQALASRMRRRESLQEVGAPARRCEFCGLVTEHNFVSCMECGIAYHSRCLSSSQAARFKGKGWYCDEHAPVKK